MEHKLATILLITIYFPSIAHSLPDTSLSCAFGKDKSCGSCVMAHCTLCFDKYPNYQGICQAPSISIDNCLSYLNKNTCAKCKDGYFLTDGKTCTQTILTSCLDEIEGKCTKCHGFEIDSDGQCDLNKKCDENCKMCFTVDDKQRCSECHDKYTLVRNKTMFGLSIKCHKTGWSRQGCKHMIANSCVECHQGFYVDSDFERRGECSFSGAWGVGSCVMLVVLFGFGLMDNK